MTEPPAAQGTCKDCPAWNEWDSLDGEPIGWCRINPPRVLHHSDDSEGGWPWTYHDGWCLPGRRLMGARDE